MPWRWIGQGSADNSLVRAHAPHRGRVVVGGRRDPIVHRCPAAACYAPMIGGIGYVLAPGPAAYIDHRCKRCLGATTELEPLRLLAFRCWSPPAKMAAGTWGVSSPRVLCFVPASRIRRYGGARGEHGAPPTLHRFHVYRHHQHSEESECVTGGPWRRWAESPDARTATRHGAEMIADSIYTAVTYCLARWCNRWVGLACHPRCATRHGRTATAGNAVLAAVERALALESYCWGHFSEADECLAHGAQKTLAGTAHAVRGVANENRTARTVGWTMDAISAFGKRIQRGLWLMALLQAAIPSAAAEQTRSSQPHPGWRASPRSCRSRRASRWKAIYVWPPWPS